MKSLETKDESLLAGKSNAKNETSAIVAEVERIGLNKDKIKGLVFDTTSVNTGIHKGICVELEKYVGRRLLLLHVLKYMGRQRVQNNQSSKYCKITGLVSILMITRY